jgi:hypothetical protein
MCPPVSVMGGHIVLIESRNQNDGSWFSAQTIRKTAHLPVHY